MKKVILVLVAVLFVCSSVYSQEIKASFTRCEVKKETKDKTDKKDFTYKELNEKTFVSGTETFGCPDKLIMTFDADNMKDSYLVAHLIAAFKNGNYCGYDFPKFSRNEPITTISCYK